MDISEKILGKFLSFIILNEIEFEDAGEAETILTYAKQLNLLTLAEICKAYLSDDKIECKKLRLENFGMVSKHKNN